jgi:hypothetical protein
MFGRGRTSRAQARRDREWRDFVRDLTASARQGSPADDARMRAFLDDQADQAGGRDGLQDPPAERAA